MKWLSKYALMIASIAVIALFLWLRFGPLDTAFEFGGDPGRDMLVLWDWKHSGKPPLLGPQTSAMPLNQSAVYFYLLYPAFLLTNGSPMSANYTVAVVWIGAFLALMWALRKRAGLGWALLVVFFMSAIQPMFVSQTRSVWNPSFLPPLLMVSFVSLFLLEEKFTRLRLGVWALTTSLAVSLHFPLGTLALAQILYGFVFLKKDWLKMMMAFAVALIFLNLPTLVFEMRHGFLISKNVLGGGWLGLAQFSRGENLKRLIDFSGGLPLWWANAVLLVVLMIAALGKLLKEKDNLLRQSVFVLVVSAVLTILSGLAFHSHYAFGFAIAWFYILARLPRKMMLPLLLCLGVVWLSPNQVARYFSPARRSLEELNVCFRQVCESEKEPMYVSMQSGVSPFHVGYEYRYLMKKNGCEVRYIESEPAVAKKMAVVVDESMFENGKTGFYELSLFGTAKLQKNYQCDKNFEVVILAKD